MKSSELVVGKWYRIGVDDIMWGNYTKKSAMGRLVKKEVSSTSGWHRFEVEETKSRSASILDDATNTIKYTNFKAWETRLVDVHAKSVFNEVDESDVVSKKPVKGSPEWEEWFKFEQKVAEAELAERIHVERKEKLAALLTSLGIPTSGSYQLSIHTNWAEQEPLVEMYDVAKLYAAIKAYGLTTQQVTDMIQTQSTNQGEHTND